MKTAVEWLAEKYDYAYWMVKRDEISPVLAEEWKKHYLERAKQMEKEQIIDAYIESGANLEDIIKEEAENYYKETFKSEKNERR